MNNNLIKIAVIGSGGIGKSTFLTKFSSQEYKEHDITIAIDFQSALLKTKDEKYHISIWDFGGEERFRFMLEDFLEGVKGILLCFDLSRRTSFIDLKEWLNFIKKSINDIPILLIGLKRDLKYFPGYSSYEVNSLVKEFNLIKYIEVSSKLNLNVDAAFYVLLEEVTNSHENYQAIYH